MAASEHAAAAPATGQEHISVVGAAFLGIGAMIGAGIFGIFIVMRSK